MPRHAKRLDSLLIKPAGPDCNLGCTYCFYLEKQALFPEAPTHRMSAEVLEETVRQVMRQGGRELAFAWQGGEPTLMGVDFFRQAVELQKKHGRGGQTVGNGLQTNGVLIDAAWCSFLREARFLVGLSLDGPAHVHDRYRRYRGGQPTWTRVTEALKRMLDHGVAVNGLVVVNDYSARFPREIYAFLKERGLTFMQFIPCLERDPGDPARPAPFSVSPEQLGRFLCEIFDCWLDDFQDGRPTTQVRWFDSVFATYVDHQPPECTLLAECGTYVVVEHNGDVFACDFFVQDEWRLGNVLEGRLEDMLNSPLQARFRRRKAALPEACQACPWLVHCRGGCPKERWGAPGEPCRSRLCEGYQMFFSHADDRLRQLAGAWLAEQNPPSAIMAAATREGPAPARVGRNAPCPCGSGAKYKHCCGK